LCSLARSISIEFSSKSSESKTKDAEDEELYEIDKNKEDKNEGVYKLVILLTNKLSINNECYIQFLK